MATLHLVIGPWGSGKSVLTNALRGRRARFVVLDWDAIIPALTRVAGRDVHAAPSTWDGLRETWRAIVEGILASGSDVVLFGPMRPEELAVDGAAVRAAYLDCPDGTLRSRLTERGESPAAIADELAMAADLRRSDLYRIDADQPLQAVVADIERWLAT